MFEISSGEIFYNQVNKMIYEKHKLIYTFNAFKPMCRPPPDSSVPPLSLSTPCSGLPSLRDNSLFLTPQPLPTSHCNRILSFRYYSAVPSLFLFFSEEYISSPPSSKTIGKALRPQSRKDTGCRRAWFRCA